MIPSVSCARRAQRLRQGVARPGEALAEERRQAREIRSYEADYVGSLWHLDFHHASLKVLTSSGQWMHPIALGILDDHSRLCCHVQWYLSETAEDLVHGLSQAIQKRGLPRALLTDNGSAMVAEEVTEGLMRLGILHERTLPYSPYQNGKQEAFWGTLEGRLMRMLDSTAQLTLELLNQATQAWVEIEYNRSVHRETSSSPVDRFAQTLHVLRPSPKSESLRDAFRLETTRRQRRSDGTISLEGVRFEIPARYRHFREVAVRYARWNLGRVDLVDPRGGTILAPIFPLDKSANADGRRALVELESTDALPARSIERPQSKGSDFYRELGDIFAVKLTPSNRWGGFKALRERWKAYVASSRIRPVLLIDEAQEMPGQVLAELRILSSTDFDATSLLTVVLSGDGRLLELLRQEYLVPLGTRIRTRLVIEAASRDELLELLSHALSKAGNAALMTAELKDTLVDHSAGNYRLLMNLAGELLAHGMANDIKQLDEKTYLEVFQPSQPRPSLRKKVRA